VLESIVRTALLTHSDKKGTLPSTFALLGLGGYGRAELNPLSDIDIMFLFPDKANSTQVDDMKKILTDEVLYPMWDLGFKVGHSTRSVRECIEEAQLDYKTRNSLLESRRILGSATLHQEMEDTYRRHLDSMDIRPYLEEMIEVQEERRNQYGNSVFAPEPNIKNGVGGLREYQGVQWLLHLMYGRAKFKQLYSYDNLYARDLREFESAYDFQLRVRSELHFNSKRATDELTIGLQQLIAGKLGYGGSALEQVEHLMKDYYAHARNSLRVARSIEQRVLITYDATRAKRRKLFRMSFKKVQRREQDGFVIESDRISVADEAAFMKQPERVVDAFVLAQKEGLKLSFDMQRLVAAILPKVTPKLCGKPEFCGAVRQLLSEPGRVYPVLEEMYSTGFLARLIPELSILNCLVQHDRFLVRYAEDEKVLKAIQRLDVMLSEPGHCPPEVVAEGSVNREPGGSLLVTAVVFAALSGTLIRIWSNPATQRCGHLRDPAAVAV
jgi:[protein-PII] uridylyltransferase